MRPIILAKDGCKTAAHLLAELAITMSIPEMKDLVGMVKINDGHFKHDMSAPDLTRGLQAVAEVTGADFGVFNDLKAGDVSATLRNVGGCFHSCINNLHIVTVSGIIAAKGFNEIRRALPGWSQIALFSVPTDMSVEECEARYWGMAPEEKIRFDIEYFMDEWEKISVNERMADKPFDLVVCSPRELDYLNDCGLGDHFGWVCPGIRDKWMAIDHQDASRITGVLEALEKGAHWVVMGTQILVGNPANGISAEESRLMTLEEISKFKPA